MFYSQFILAKKGPLGTIWIAAHLERKLRKNQVADTDIGTSVDNILSSDVPIALRLSSHLLLGVVKIYSKKVNYLFDDCSETLLKVKQAFRSAIVDLPPEEAKAPYLSITLPETFDLDDFELPESALFHGNYVDRHVSAREHITLQDTMEGIVYSTTKFGLDERFGDGDATQCGLDLEDILLDENAAKESNKHVPGVDSEGLASVRPTTPVKIDDINKGMSDTSDPITDKADRNQVFFEATHSIESVKPQTFQIENPKLLNSLEKLHSDHAPVTENHDLVERSRVAETDPNEFNNPDLQQRHGSGNCSMHAEIVSETTAFDFGRSAYRGLENTPPPHISTMGKLLDDSSLSGSSKQQKPGCMEFESACSSGHNDLHVVVSVTNYSSACASGHVLVNGQMLGIRLGGDVPISDTYSSKPVSALETMHPKFSQESACHKDSGDILGTNQSSVIHAERFCVDSLSDQLAACTIQSSHISENEMPQMQGGRYLPTLYDDGFTGLVGVSGVNFCMQGASNPPIEVSDVGMDANNGVLKDNRVVNAHKCSSSVLPQAVNFLPGQMSARDYNNELGDHNYSIPNDTRLKFFDKSTVLDSPGPERLLSVPERANYTPNSFIRDCTSNNEVQTGKPNSPQHVSGKIDSGKKRSLTESTLIMRSHSSNESFGLEKPIATSNSIPDEADLLSSILVGRESSILKVLSTPRPDESPVKRLRIETRVSSKRKALLDDSIILQADTIRKQLISTEDIRRVRRKAPCTCPEIWMLQKLSMEDEVFLEPLSTGISSELSVLHVGVYSSGRDEKNASIDCVNGIENEANPNNCRKTICDLNLEDRPVDAVVTSSDGQFAMLNKASEKDVSLPVNSCIMPDCELNSIATDSTTMVGTNGCKLKFTQTSENLKELQVDRGKEVLKGDFLGRMRENDKTVDGKCIPADFVSTGERFGEMRGNDEVTGINPDKCVGLVSRNELLDGTREADKAAEYRQVTHIEFVPTNGLFMEIGESSKAIEARQVTDTEFILRTESLEQMRESHEVRDALNGAHEVLPSNIENLDLKDSNQAVEARQSRNLDSVPRKFLETSVSNQGTEARQGIYAEFMSRGVFFRDASENNKAADGKHCNLTEFVPSGGEYLVTRRSNKTAEPRESMDAEICPRSEVMGTSVSNQEAEVRQGMFAEFMSRSEFFKEMSENDKIADDNHCNHMDIVPSGAESLTIGQSNQAAEARQVTCIADFVPNSAVLMEMREHNQTAVAKQSTCAGFVRSGGEYLAMRQSDKAAEAGQSMDAEICPRSEGMGTSVSNQEAEIRQGMFAEFMPRSDFFTEMNNKTADDKHCNHMDIVPSGAESLAMGQSNQAAIADIVLNSVNLLEMNEHNQTADAKQSTCTGFVPISANLMKINASNKTGEVRHAIHQKSVSCSGAVGEINENNQAAKSAEGIYSELVSSSKVLVEMRLCTQGAESRPAAYREFVASSEVSGEMRESNQASEDRQASTESSSFHGDSFHLFKNTSKEPTYLCSQAETYSQGTHEESHLLLGASNHFSQTVHQKPACLCNHESIRKHVPNYSTGESMVLGDSSAHLSKNRSRELPYLCNQAEADKQSYHRESHFLVGASNHLSETVHEKPACLCNQECIKKNLLNNVTEPTCLCNQAETGRQGTQGESHLLVGVSNHHSETVQQMPAYLCDLEPIKMDVLNYATEDSAVLTKGAVAVANNGSYDRLSFGSASTPDKRLEILFALGHEDNVKEMASNIQPCQHCKEPDAVLATETVDSEHCGRGFCDPNKAAFGNDPEFPQMDGVEDIRMSDNGVSLLEDVDLPENSGWSARTRAIAKYLQTWFSKDDCERKVVDMERLLSGKTCKESSRMFFETLVLKSRDYIDVSQEKPFESICITPQPKLMKSNFEE